MTFDSIPLSGNLAGQERFLHGYASDTSPLVASSFCCERRTVRQLPVRRKLPVSEINRTSRSLGKTAAANYAHLRASRAPARPLSASSESMKPGPPLLPAAAAAAVSSHFPVYAVRMSERGNCFPFLRKVNGHLGRARAAISPSGLVNHRANARQERGAPAARFYDYR